MDILKIFIIYVIIISKNVLNYMYKCNKTILINHYNFMKHINMVKNYNTICLYNNIENTIIVLKYISSAEKCNNTKFMYYIPENPYVECKKILKKNQNFTHIQSCMLNKEQTIHNVFNSTNKILKHGCKTEFNNNNTYKNKVLWWAVFLKNNELMYRISRCLDVYHEITLNIYIKHNNIIKMNKNVTISTTKPVNIHFNTIMNRDYNFEIHLNSLYNSNKYNFTNKCIVETPYYNYYIISNCDENNSILYGKIGKINCPTAIDAYKISDKCQVASGLVSISYKNYNLKKYCKLKNKNLNSILKKNILPIYNKKKNIYINYNNTKNTIPIYAINYLNPNVSLNIKLNNIVKCDIISKSIIYLKFKYVYYLFNIMIRSNFNSTISFECNDNDLIIPSISHIGLFKFYKLNIYFTSKKQIYNTSCNILCNNNIMLKNIKFVSKYISQKKKFIYFKNTEPSYHFNIKLYIKIYVCLFLIFVIIINNLCTI